ncbi:asparaginase [Echinimonas agarilytica]|uniref:L-asparaginase 1 n=1 Tax=Echinimonas agarilytica TaxID=1215918 RepID=A0AA41WA21_9GAMM|nr:asparaginase [Echinimonas agarilytica]MCM2680804.1 asparaginase [Echinimonas agarilytica]
MRKSIYVAYTGGTIGMRRSSGGYVPTPGHLVESLAAMPEFHRDEMPLFEIHEYDDLIDSSDMAPTDWQRIADDVQANYDRFDGFVVLHGTDTMAFTAAALSFMLTNLTKPVIVTGSQIPLAELRSDGQINLLNSLYLAANYPVAEVCLFFNNQLFRGNRSSKVNADGFDAFASPNYPSLIDVGIDIRVNAGLISHHTGQEPLNVQTITPQPIGLIRLYPGIMPELVNNIIRQPVKAIIMQSYGVGNGPSSGALLNVFKEADEQGIVVVNATQCLKGRVNMAGYATGNKIAETGAVSGMDMTIEAVLTKLHFLLSQNLEPSVIKQSIQQNLRGELTL